MTMPPPPPPPKRAVPFWLIIAVVLIGLVWIGGRMAGESGGDDGNRCEPVSRALLDGIETGLTVSGGGSLSSGQAVRSDDFEQVWFVAAEIDGPGLEGDGDIGLWATNSVPGGSPEGLIFAVDAIAREFSDWGAGGATDAQLSTGDDGASEAVDCLG